MKLEKNNSKILRFSSVNFDRFHRKRPIFGTVLPGPALYYHMHMSSAYSLIRVPHVLGRDQEDLKVDERNRRTK